MIEEASETEDCTFCTWGCDYGVSNEYFLHPVDAANDYCGNYHVGSNTFIEEWVNVITTEGHNHNRISHERLEELRKMPKTVLEEGPPRPKYILSNPCEELLLMIHRNIAKSKYDGRDISRFQGVHFCKGSVYRQVDVKKARICEDCRKEKFDIMKHRHGESMRKLQFPVLVNSASSLMCQERHQIKALRSKLIDWLLNFFHCSIFCLDQWPERFQKEKFPFPVCASG